MKDISRASKSLEFFIAIAKSKLSVDQKKVDEIEQEAINALIDFKIAVEGLDGGCIVLDKNDKCCDTQDD